MVTRATLRVETNSGDAEAGVIPVDMTETHSQDPDAAKELGDVVKIIKSVRRHIVIGKGEKMNLFPIHHFRHPRVGNGEKLKPFRSASGSCG